MQSRSNCWCAATVCPLPRQNGKRRVAAHKQVVMDAGLLGCRKKLGAKIVRKAASGMWHPLQFASACGVVEAASPVAGDSAQQERIVVVLAS